jgi:dynein heavy chain
MVEELQANLVKEQATVEEKMAATAALLTRVGADQLIVGEEKEKAAVEEGKCTEIAETVSAFQAQCAKDLEAAEPIIAAAEAALNSLDKASLTELKAFASPAKEIVDVLGALMVMTAKGKLPNDRSWAQGKKLLGDVGKLLNDLLTYDKDHCNENAVAFVEKTYIIDPGFDAEAIKSKSKAASGLCGWIVNVCKYFRIYQDVAPKRAKAAEAEKELAAANVKLKVVRDKVADLDAKLNALLEQFEQATEEKNNAIATAEKTQLKANMANRLVAGLADEKVRWAESIGQFEQQERNLVGDAMLASAFACYIGAFSAEYRDDLVLQKWAPDLKARGIPGTEDITPLEVLANEADQATWNNEGLPTDSVSVQNGAIMMNAARWSLMIDPQLQGIAWIRNKEQKNNLKIVSQSTPRYLDAIEQCISNGEPCLIENLPEELDAVLDPILARSLIKKGKAIKIGDKEVDYDPKFKLYLQTKLSNPHYKPEVAAQTTIVNFMVTQQGLEDQLLAIVVNKERPDLEEQKTELLAQQNQFKITLKELEDNLLYRLANAEGDILADVELIENLEITKKTSKDIQAKVAEAKVTEKTINKAREAYRAAAVRGALLYFLVDSLWILDHFYRYSMANFVIIFKKGMDMAEAREDVNERVKAIIDTACYTTFAYIAQGLFERHKLILATQLCFLILKRNDELDLECFNFLIKGKTVIGVENPLNEWLSDESWAAIQALRELEGFDSLPDDMVGGAKRFKEWYELERPEEQGLPGDLKKLPEFKKLLVIKCLRPDRMTEAMSSFVKIALEPKYVRSEPFDFPKAYEDAQPEVPMFFVLSPGVDPVKDVERLGAKLGFTAENGKFSNVSLGQGQEPVAERAVENGHKNGNWVFLQNIHLTPNWTGGKKGYLEKRVEKIAEGAHVDFRLYLSAEPEKVRMAGLPDVMPIAILQASIKLTNEPPEGLKANQLRAWSNFNEEMFENSSKQTEFKAICFALSFFHAILIERKKFGSQGWNRVYPFNMGDLLNSAMVASNYLEANPKVPWDDLRYIFGEIMYGGHVTDDFDRRLVNAYLLTYMYEELLEGLEFFPGYGVAPPGNVKVVAQYIEEFMPQESPIAFGMHPNAEIGFRLDQATLLFKNISELQPRSASGGGGMTMQERVKLALEEIQEKMPDKFVFQEVLDKVEDRSPYVNVFLQEVERMIVLQNVMMTSLFELGLGLNGDLTISAAMETLMGCLNDDLVPATWEKYAWPTLRRLGSWVGNFQQRHARLNDWTQDLQLPKVTWISGLFNPQSFLTAVQQTTARRQDWPLDKTVVQTEVTKKQPEEVSATSREGAYVTGLSLEGARWDDKSGAGALDESKPKELFAPMPVVLIKAVTVDKAEVRDAYLCPVYKTTQRGPTYVFTGQLRSKMPQSKWILGGVAMIMDTTK